MPFVKVAELGQTEPVSGYRLRFVHAGQMTVTFWDVEAGAVMPEHSHPQEQVSIMVEGEFELTLAGESRIVRPGDLVVIPTDAVHSGRALTCCRIHDVFHPRRDDFKQARPDPAGRGGGSR